MNIALKPLFLVLLAGLSSHAFADETSKPVTEQLVDTLTQLSGGPHAKFRANHAKGIVAEGVFTPAASAAEITKASIFTTSNPVTVRYSDATGVPNIPDADGNAFPKGIAIRFNLPDQSLADLVCISVNGFPSATPEDFLGLLNAVAASGKETSKPTTIEKYLGSHPAALKFVTTPKLPPESFATQAFFGVNAFKFTNAKGETHYGRYRIEPVDGQKFLSPEAAKAADANYLMNDLPVRLKKGPYSYKISVQIADAGDTLNDPTVTWPDTRRVVELGTLQIKSIKADGASYERQVMFSPLNLVDGIEPSEDPILLARPSAYAVSFGRRLQ